MSSHEGDIVALEPERIESLRLILEKEQCRPITYDEALEVGRSLVRFFKALAEEA
jgi:hypothetical protein